MTLLIAFFLLSIIFSFLCSIWEAVLLSVTPSYIKRKQQDDPVTGEILLQLKDDIDKPLSAILTLNTIAHTVGAIGVGAQAGELYGSSSLNIFGLELAYESIIATLMTLGILFLSEIIPKTIGANNWQGLAPFTARSLKALTLVLKPFVWVSNQLTKLLKKDKGRSVFSRQDFAAMAEVVEESGGISRDDLTLINNVLHFDDLTAKDVMTPRRVVVMANEDRTLSEYFEGHKPFTFSRIPLFKGNRDNITGVLLKDQMLQEIIEGRGDEALHTIRREVIHIPHTMPLRKVFQTLNQPNGHLGLVSDEYGSVIGLVTLEDVIETLFGLEIMDETDKVKDLQQYARRMWDERAERLGLEDQEGA